MMFIGPVAAHAAQGVGLFPPAAATDTIVTSPGEPVTPFEFAEDLRNLPYFALRSSANQLKPYRPQRRAPATPKYPATFYEPSSPFAQLPAAPMPGPDQNFLGLSFNDTCVGGQCGSG